MTRDDIIRMAREAGLLRSGDGWTEPHRWGATEVERFATLVAAAERNRTWTQAHWTEYEHSIAAAEREACAKVADSLGVHPALNVYNGGPDWYKHGKEIATAIRARN